MKTTISRAAFFAALTAAVPAMADDAALQQSVNTLSQQVQQQQEQIDRLLGTLKNQKPARRAARTAQPVVESSEPVVDATQNRPGVVAPLQPTSLGQLKVGETTVNAPTTLNAVSQATPAPVPVPPTTPQPPAVAFTPAQQQTQHPVAVAAAPAVAQQQPQQAALSKPLFPNSGQPNGPVGEAPPQPTKPPDVQALANVGGVLTPYGKVSLEPFLQYSNSSVNSFLFNGVEVVDAVLIGALNANKTEQNLVTGGVTARVGVSDRMELEARIPYVWRNSQVTNTVTDINNGISTSDAQGYGIGDLELAAHYQINDGQEDWPFFIGNLRYKSDTGSSPYKSEYNTDGSAHTLATGTGFNAIEPSVTVIYPSDPATLFANLGYIHSFGEDINGNVGNSGFVGNVSPGDTYSASVGMGVALNDKLSFTLGYEHDVILPTSTVVNGATQNSQTLQVGSALSGISYRINPRTSIAFNLDAGVTQDAPDVVIGVRVPILLDAF